MTERMERLRDAGSDAVQQGVEAAQRGVERAQDAVSLAAASARTQAEDAAERAAAVVAKVKPRLRGVVHEYSFFAALLLGAFLIIRAEGAVATTAMAIYAAGICGLFGISALYHRVTWKPRARVWMKRLDHSMIFVFIAASVTPFALLAADGALAITILCVAWGGAIAGVVLSLAWIGAPKWVSAIVYVALGLVGAALAPDLIASLGWTAALGVALGGVLYIIGAVIYAAERPDPAPAVFGYHEIFHSLVTGAAATHYAVIAFALLPLAA
ncbi:MAG: hemolysin III family protein [Solirubrobacteraceae bacterium]|jgi:hemolysin III|nr:hemolysin III family protein [Solirubrobacteraceae bacterium]